MPFKLDLEALKATTPEEAFEDVMEEIEATLHRYRPEPTFSKTGKGYLKPQTPEDKEAELERMRAFTKKLEERKKRYRAQKNSGG